MLRKHSLVRHPSTRSRLVSAVEVELQDHGDGEIELCFQVRNAQNLVVPPFQSREREDGLWRTTCFECFLKKPEGHGYIELNASPSGRWASYDFDEYRGGMRNSSRAFVMFSGSGKAAEPGTYACDVILDISMTWPGPMQLALAAVIEEEGGTKSYWALAHPPGAPDFHHPDCFQLELPPPAAP